MTSSFLFAANAGPTESRTWTSAAGTTLTATATGISGGKVAFVRPDGGQLEVALDQLMEADRKFLEEHFGAADGALPANLPVPPGKTAGPIETPEGHRYLLYIPKSLKEGREAPLVLVSVPRTNHAKYIDRLQEGAELCGWVIAVSLDSKNGNDAETNLNFIVGCRDHVQATVPIDPERIYFSGSSGGGSAALWNNHKLKGAGALVSVAPYAKRYGIRDSVDHFFLTGSYDFNRTATANLREALGKRAVHRFWSGGHGGAPEWMFSDGVIWLHARQLMKSAGEERDEFEAAALAWLEKLKTEQPERAYDWAMFFRDEFRPSRLNATRFSALADELGRDERNVAYHQFLKDADQFSVDVMAGFGPGSKTGHTDPKLVRAAERLAKKYEAYPDLKKIAEEFGRKSDTP